MKKVVVWIPAVLMLVVLIVAIVGMMALVSKSSPVPLAPTVSPTPLIATAVVVTAPAPSGQAQECTGELIAPVDVLYAITASNFSVAFEVKAMAEGPGDAAYVIIDTGSELLELHVGDEVPGTQGNPEGRVTAIDDDGMHFCQYK